MKYIKPTDFLAVREFQDRYKRIENDITELLTTDGSAATADELNKKLKSALNAAILYLSRVNAKYTKEELTRAFNEGKGQADEPPQRTIAEVNEILSAQGFRYAKNAFSQNTYIELQQSMQVAGQSLTRRVNGIIKRLAKTGDDSIYNVQQAIVADLQRNGVLTVEYKNGAKQPISSYAAMAARSARIESTNIGSIGRALQAGTDLVKMTEMPQCCAVCGAYQGKVYSISGKDKRFPALFKTVLSRGYALPHPNCRHEFIPYFTEIEDPTDVERMIKQSQIEYDSKGNLVDVRWQKDIQAYAAWQAGNRQRNAELHEYKRMRDHYAGRESEMPYKTLAAFRTARRRDELSPAFKAWRYRERDEVQYEELKSLLGASFPVKSIDEFRKIKYNVNRKQYREILKQRNKAVLEQEKAREPKDFVLAKTVSDAEMYMRRRAKSVSYAGITNTQSLNQANRTYAYLADKYGIKELSEVSTRMYHKGAFAESHGDLLRISKRYFNNPADEQIAISTSKKRWLEYTEKAIETHKEHIETYKDYKTYVKKEKKLLEEREEGRNYSRFNVIYEDREIESIITHEVGHIIAEQRFKHISKRNTEDGYIGVVSDVYKKAKQTKDIYKISQYAAKDHVEFFAECFAVYEMGIEELPDYIKSMIEEIVK